MKAFAIITNAILALLVFLPPLIFIHFGANFFSIPKMHDECPSCDYSANIERAVTKRTSIEAVKIDKAMEVVDTPNKSTIEDVCEFLSIPQSASLKALVYTAVKGGNSKQFLFIILN